ncbi:hypothetical protein K8R47_00950 [archaeon]|nr:hypothetical protein [archaeon]
MKLLFIIFVLSLLIISGCSDLQNSYECDSKGGRIVNTLSEDCYLNETNMGDVKGLRCPCICCVPNQK